METETQNLYKMSTEELKELAKELDVKLAPNAGKDALRDAIFVAQATRVAKLKARVAANLEAEAVKTLDLSAQPGGRPLPEDVAILASKRWYVKFTNMEQPREDGMPGATVSFVKGTHKFTLYDGKIHCLPGVLLAEDVEQVPNVLQALTVFFNKHGLPMQDIPSKPTAPEMAKGVIARLSIMGQIRLDAKRDHNATSATFPVFEDVKTSTGETVSRLTRTDARWQLHRLGEANPDTPFGLTTDTEELQHARGTELVHLG